VVKPLNNGRSQSPKCCSLFSGFSLYKVISLFPKKSAIQRYPLGDVSLYIMYMLRYYRITSSWNPVNTIACVGYESWYESRSLLVIGIDMSVPNNDSMSCLNNVIIYNSVYLVYVLYG